MHFRVGMLCILNKLLILLQLNKYKIYILEPNGIAESEQWEIRWAKPIGPIKQAERKRCISEAISGTKTPMNTKHNGLIHRRSNQENLSPTANGIENFESINFENVNALSKLVAERYYATCILECMTLENQAGFIHRVNKITSEFFF